MDMFRSIDTELMHQQDVIGDAIFMATAMEARERGYEVSPFKRSDGCYKIVVHKPDVEIKDPNENRDKQLIYISVDTRKRGEELFVKIDGSTASYAREHARTLKHAIVELFKNNDIEKTSLETLERIMDIMDHESSYNYCPGRVSGQGI